MAKKRRSILDADPSEIKNVGKEIMNQSPTSKEKSPKPKPQAKKVEKKPGSKGKRKFVYLNEEAHREVKIQATIRGVTIQEHLTSLIYGYKENNS